jgi:hypothetical protein
MWEDPIVEEVRKVRREIEVENEDDFGRIFSSAIEVQKRYQNRVISRPKNLTKEEEKLPTVSRI